MCEATLGVHFHTYILETDDNRLHTSIKVDGQLRKTIFSNIDSIRYVYETLDLMSYCISLEYYIEPFGDIS